jgi:cytoskeletal protein CcmA (bactofilin family)
MFGYRRRAKNGTVIASGASLEGSLRSDGEIHVEGRVHGSVDSTATVSVGTTGTIHGDVRADEVTVGGRVEGTVVATARLRMLATGTIQGDARYGSLEVDRGGQIEGRTVPIGGLGGPMIAEEGGAVRWAGAVLPDDALIELPPAATPAPIAPSATPSPSPTPPAPAHEEPEPPREAGAPRDSTPPPLSGGTGRTRPLPLPRPLEKSAARPVGGGVT